MNVNIGKVEIETVVRNKVKGFGNGAHIMVPKEHIGKKCIILVLTNETKIPTRSKM